MTGGRRMKGKRQIAKGKSEIIFVWVEVDFMDQNRSIVLMQCELDVKNKTPEKSVYLFCLLQFAF
jgi:hypothetical protein